MSDELRIAEEAAVAALAHAYGADAEVEEVEKFDFDAEFQTKIAAHTVRDLDFMRRAAHLVRPEYFENVGEAALVNLALKFFQSYQSVPDTSTMVMLLKEARESGILKGEVMEAAKTVFRQVYTGPLVGGNYAAEKVAEFSRHQAVTRALLASVEQLGKKGGFEKIDDLMGKALAVGINEDGDEYDYWDKITDRTEERMERAAGKLPPQGITTGNIRFDDLLYHKGWGRKELSIIMGGAKAGKTTALIGFGKAASLAGKNVLYITLEVSAKIISERLDASISDTEMRELGKAIHDVRTKVQALQKRAGKLKIHEFPSGTFTPSMLRRLIERYKSKGIKFDLIVIDYADLMAPDFRYNDAIENSKGVYTGLRAIAFEEDVAMLSATQTNREGFKSSVAKAEHVAEDFNKIRIADLVISINITEEERANNEARLYFAASRNQESGFTIFIKQNVAKMKFMESILRIE